MIDSTKSATRHTSGRVELLLIERNVLRSRYKSVATLREHGRLYTLPVSAALMQNGTRFRKYVLDMLGLEIATDGDWWNLVLGVVR